MERGSSERLCCGVGGELLRAWLLRACLRAAVGRGLVWVRGAPSLVCGGFAGRIFFCLLWTQERARCLYSYSCCVALARLAFAFFLCLSACWLRAGQHAAQACTSAATFAGASF